MAERTTRMVLAVIHVLWRAVLFVLAFALASAAFIAPLATLLSEWAEAFPLRAQLYRDIGGALSMLAATWVMTRLVDRRPFSTIGFANKDIFRDLSVGLVLGVGWLAVSVGGAWAAGWATPQATDEFSGTLVLVAATSVLYNVLTQQLLLCGYIFQTIRSQAGFRVALLVSAALFSAMHGVAFQGAWIPAANVFAAGVLFCLAYGITGNLWLPLAIHFMWNLLLGPVLGLTVSGTGQMGLGWSMFEVEGPDLLTGGTFGLEGSLVVTITTALLIVTLSLIHSRQRAEISS